MCTTTKETATPSKEINIKTKTVMGENRKNVSKDTWNSLLEHMHNIKESYTEHRVH